MQCRFATQRPPMQRECARYKCMHPMYMYVMWLLLLLLLWRNIIVTGPISSLHSTPAIYRWSTHAYIMSIGRPPRVAIDSGSWKRNTLPSGCGSRVSISACPAELPLRSSTPTCCLLSMPRLRVTSLGPGGPTAPVGKRCVPNFCVHYTGTPKARQGKNFCNYLGPLPGNRISKFRGKSIFIWVTGNLS